VLNVVLEWGTSDKKPVREKIAMGEVAKTREMQDKQEKVTSRIIDDCPEKNIHEEKENGRMRLGEHTGEKNTKKKGKPN